MKTKVCIICHQEKSIDLFRTERNTCLSCKSEYLKIYRSLHKKERKEYMINNKQILNQKRRDRYKNDKDHRETVIKQSTKYSQQNKEKVRKYRRQYEKIRTIKDPIYKLTRTLRRRILLSVQLQRTSKAFKTKDLLGCSVDFLMKHLQQTAISNGYLDFNVYDYDSLKYHLDHIIPCDAFNLQCSFHQKICFHWSNLQILTANENMSKGKNFIL